MPKEMTSQERDPNGIDQHEAGAKMDEGKPLAGLVLGNFSHGLQDIVAVGTYGATKYTPCGWLEVPSGVERYTDAMWRHLLASNYEELDPQTGLTHLAHVGWNVLAILELRSMYETK